ncbi:biosynthetic peptidoglycan transglycosylase-like isoform X1 [Phoenix dactylifera]|uniref:Biosynthetic peptidoglycan transglycosylase-like isoform X1 n=1 Tax=Phoenix dactylifera TaxID=42345 RepID=A0A8B8JC32_PHODC|nr:biosynthetic peptidoglycan transglycosylase-like isoform X1 [Phoenix dactylifera]
MSLLGPTHPLLVTAAGPRDSRHRLVALRNSPTPFPFLSSTPKPNPLRFPVRCGAPQPPVDSQKPWPSLFRFLNHLPVSLLSAGFLCAHAFLRALPADFPDRWRHLLEFSKGAETKVTQLPYHLIQAVMASEDRRFFYHFGVDPYGIGRAVVYYPNGGGGSTITQQLVKNVFLTNERKISRKFVEGILSLILERRMSKWEILYSYLNKMYWGHGKFGIESASLFYFGKHPSLLNVGESALLVGILPSPETFNPFTNPTSVLVQLRKPKLSLSYRGKSSQARALRRMVAAGFLDLETALVIVSQPLCLHTDGIGEEYEDFRKQMRPSSAIKDIWNWEMASIAWEVRENMEKWAMKMHKSR